MEYPEIIQLETSGACNATCSFCPHSSMNRTASERMPAALFERLIDEVSTWPVAMSHILPFLTNEPFADSRIYEFCRYVNSKLSATKLAFFTNGSLFTDGNLDKLSTVKNIDFIHISLHHGNKEDYEKDLGISYQRTLDSIRRLIDRDKWDVRIGRVQNGDAVKDSEFLAMCASVFPNINTMLCRRLNWKGEIASPFFPYENTLDRHCSRHNTLTVLADGRVALCCMDEFGTYALGDTRTNSLLDIYNSETALSYRTRIKRDSTPCNTCNMI